MKDTMLYDLVASDFDMTLCPPGGVVGERTRAAIRRVREAGAHFTVVSGRTTAGLLHNLALQRKIRCVVFARLCLQRVRHTMFSAKNCVICGK